MDEKEQWKQFALELYQLNQAFMIQMALILVKYIPNIGKQEQKQNLETNIINFN